MSRITPSVPSTGRPIGWPGKAVSWKWSKMMSSGVSLRLPDLLQDDPPLPLQLLRLEDGVGQDVADDVGGERDVLLQHLAVVGGLLAGGVGVDVAADRLDLLRDRGGACARSVPLKAMCSRKCETPFSSARLVAGAGGDIGAERDGLDPVHAARSRPSGPRAGG